MKQGIVYCWLLIVIFLVQPLYAPSPEAITPDEYDRIVFEWTRTCSEVMQLVKEKHYKVVDPQRSMIKAIDAFLSDIDPHSSLLDPDNYKTITESIRGEFFGVGIVIDNTRENKDKMLTIVEVLPGGPADKAGIKQYDKIIEINNNAIEGKPTEEIIRLLKGPKDSTVTIKILREGANDVLAFTVTRDVIKDQNALSFCIKNHNICYFSLTMFTDTAVTHVRSLLQQAIENRYKGLILDLRNNSGGLLNAAIDIASLFLDKNSLVVVTKDKHNKEIDQYRTNKDPLYQHSLPIFILINNYTASAAEILAGCLQTYAQHQDQKNPLHVFLVGTPTFGKGSVQEVIPISNNSAAKITTSLYFLPHDIPVQATGIKPDFLVERLPAVSEQTEWFTATFGRENNLTNHISLSGEKPAKKEKPKKENNASNNGYIKIQDRVKNMLQTDNQLRTAISLINSLHTATHYKIPLKNRQDKLEYLHKQYLTPEKLEIEEIKL